MKRELTENPLSVAAYTAMYITNVPGRKTDVNDATWIADLLAHGLIRSSFVPPTPIQDMRALRIRASLIPAIAEFRPTPAGRSTVLLRLPLGAGPWQSWDFVVPYLRKVLAFIGIEDVRLVRVEGMNMPLLSEGALSKAERAVETLAL